MEKKKLICSACDAQLTAALRAIETVDDARRICDFDCGDECSPVPTGHVLFVEGEVLKDRQRAWPGWNPDSKPEVWMHLGDVAPFVELTSDASRLSGCCGPSGRRPNRLCACGAYVGIETSDCWTYHMFEPVAENTKWKDCNHD